VLNNKYSMCPKETISFAILCCARGWMKWFTVHFENTSLALIANQKVCFSITSAFQGTEASLTIRKKENARAIQSLCNSSLAFRTKTQVIPYPGRPSLNSLIMYPSTTCNLKQLDPPVRVNINKFCVYSEMLDVSVFR